MSMLRAELYNPNHPELGVTTVPFPIPKEEYSHVLELLEALEIGDPIKRDCCIAEMEGWCSVLSHLQGNVNLEELDYLIKRLDSFDDQEAAQFQAMAHKLNLTDMTDFINLTFCCQQATVITDFSDLEKIGKDHYLTVMGGCCSTEDYEQVNGVETAHLLLDRDDATITPYGVVYDNGMKMEALYNGVHFPEYLYERIEAMARVIDDAGKMTCLYFPMPEAQITRLLERSQVDGQKFSIDNMNLSVKVMDVIEDSGSGLFAINTMCAAISGLDKAGREKLDAIIDMAFPEDPEEVTQLIRNMEQFDFCPDVYDCESLGRYMIQESGHFEYDPNLDEFYDYQRYGEQKMNGESGKFTAQGYIVYTGAMSLDELMKEDPAEKYQAEQGFQMGGMT